MAKVAQQTGFQIVCATGDPAILEAASAVWNPSHFGERIVPRLLDAGASEDQIRALTVDNPRRFFAGEKLPALG